LSEAERVQQLYWGRLLKPSKPFLPKLMDDPGGAPTPRSGCILHLIYCIGIEPLPVMQFAEWEFTPIAQSLLAERFDFEQRTGWQYNLIQLSHALMGILENMGKSKGFTKETWFSDAGWLKDNKSPLCSTCSR